MSSVCVIVPCYNEQEVLEEFHRRATVVANDLPEKRFIWLFIDDCSTDRTPEILADLASRDPTVQIVRLATNRGHQIAVTAGLDFADAEAVVIIDADLQDPPELIPEMLECIDQGYDVVHAQRKRRHGESWFKRMAAAVFYRILARVSRTEIVRDCGDFRAISRRVLETARAFREPHRFLRGLFSQIGFRQCILRFERDPRYAGEPKYTLRKMVHLSADGFFSFSSAPIRAIAGASIMLWCLALVYLAYSLVMWTQGLNPTGWTSVVLLMSFYTGLILLSISIVGAYVGRIFEQGQDRPLYWLDSAHNVDLDALGTRRSSSRELRLGQSVGALQTPRSRVEPRIFEAKLAPRHTPSASRSG